MSLSHAPTSRDARVCPPPTARWRLAIKGPNVNVRQVRYAASEAGAADIGSRVLRARARLQTSERATRPPPRRRIRGLSGPTGMRVAPAYGLRSHRTWQRECASLCTVTIGRYRHPVTCPTSRLPPSSKRPICQCEQLRVRRTLLISDQLRTLHLRALEDRCVSGRDPNSKARAQEDARHESVRLAFRS